MDLQSTVLHVGHHGSRTSSTPSFIDAVNPQIAIISSGQPGAYGHPHQETLNTLRDRDITVHRTDLEGTLIVSSDGVSVLAVQVLKRRYQTRIWRHDYSMNAIPLFLMKRLSGTLFARLSVIDQSVREYVLPNSRT